MKDGDFKILARISVSGPIEDVPLFRHRRLYAIMLQPWFPWRLRKWIENHVLARLPTRLVTKVEHFG